MHTKPLLREDVTQVGMNNVAIPFPKKELEALQDVAIVLMHCCHEGDLGQIDCKLHLGRNIPL